MDPYALDEVKETLYEIIDAYVALQKGDTDRAILQMKQCIRRFRDAYLNEYRLSASYARVRVKGRLIVGYICSTETCFPLAEAVWKWLHYYRITHAQEYFEDHPQEIKGFEGLEKRCIDEVDKAINEKLVETLGDVHRLTESFDMMVHLAHLGPDKACLDISNQPEDAIHDQWFDINPWRLPKGRSMLIDYWYNIPLELHPIGHMVLDRLASSEIRTVEDLSKLRQEVEEWDPVVNKRSS